MRAREGRQRAREAKREGDPAGLQPRRLAVLTGESSRGGKLRIWHAATGEERLVLETGCLVGFAISSARTGAGSREHESPSKMPDHLRRRDGREAQGAQRRRRVPALGVVRARRRRVIGETEDGDVHLLDLPDGRETLCLWEREAAYLIAVATEEGVHFGGRRDVADLDRRGPRESGLEVQEARTHPRERENYQIGRPRSAAPFASSGRSRSA